MSKKDNEINRQLIFNSGGANPEDYLTPKQLQRYQDNPERFIDIDIDLAMFTPGSDEGRTDTYEAQKKLQEDDVSTEQEFDEAQQGLRDANTNFQRLLGIVGALNNTATGVVGSIVDSIGKDNSIVTPEQPVIEDVPQYPVVIQRILKVKQDNPEAFTGIVNSINKQGKLSSNEKVKQSLLKDEPIELPATYKGGPKTFREEADFFDVSAAIIGGGKENRIDPETGKFYEYDRLAVTEFGKRQKGKNRNIIFEHIKKNIGAKNITREEFDKYADEQSAGERDLRNAIRLLNLKSYAANRYIDLTPYDTKEKQLKFLDNINKAKSPPKRRKDRKTGEFTEDAESFEARYKIWQMDTAPFQQYTDYKETFDYGHIISAKTAMRIDDVGANRISNTEIEAAHNIVSRDPRTQKIIEILQEGNRERGARRDYLPSIQMMRNTSASVVEDFVKWQSSQPGAEGPNLTEILDKFMPREQHDNYLKYIQKRFYEKRSLSGSLKQFLENEIGIPYEDYVKFPNRLKLKAKALYKKDQKESGNVLGKQQYAQGTKWMQEAADAFIQLHHFDKNKRLRTTKEDTQLQDIDDAPKNFQDLLDILNQE